MREQPDTMLADLDVAAPPPVYQIRVRGRIEGSLWARWFEGMDVVPDGGETILVGPVADQAALHGLLSRVRDLHLPLVSVNLVSDSAQSLAAAQARSAQKRNFGSLWHWKERSSMDTTRTPINWMLILVYLLVGGGLATLTVFLTSEHLLATSLALAVLFAMLGGIAFTFGVADGGRGWRIMASLAWLAAAIPLVIYLITAGWLHPALAIAIMLFLAAGGALYFVARSRLPELRALEPSVRWERLGERQSGEQVLTPSERDRGPEPAPVRETRRRS